MENNGIIKADPTKRFFLYMLTRDISIERAIIDLIDNSIDGAKRLRPNGNYQGLWIRLNLSESEMSITDNCGGIPLEIAKDYAFCFGRPEEYDEIIHKEIKGGIGRFGVGMKRALFKAGQNFLVESKNKADHFEIKQDIFEWVKKINWEFEFNSVKDASLKEDGTHVSVKQLFPNISGYFTIQTFFNNLKKEIGITVGKSIDKGLVIYINDNKVASETIEFITVDDYRPIKKYAEIENVRVTVFAGIGVGDTKMAGWYIYMNDRLVLANDRTNVTGWQDKDSNDPELTKYASKHATFRGVIYFESDDSADLPMTTTKTGVDVNHKIYKRAKQEVIIPAMTEIFTLINHMKTVKNVKELPKNNPSYKLVKVEDLRVNNATYSETVVYPNNLQTDGDQFVKISFKKEIEIVERVKERFKVTNANDAGEKTFDVYVKNNKLGLNHE
jgi:hypothetical protein